MSKEIPRHANGLIDYSELVLYFPPRSTKVPFGILPSIHWKNHHAYYLYWEWNRPDLPDEEKDQTRIKFRGKRYNRLMLLPPQEEAIHNRWRTVDPEGISVPAAEAALRDFEDFNMLGVASAAYNLAKDARRRYFDGQVPKLAPELNLTRAEQMAFFAAKRETSLDKIENPEVTPRDVVASIVMRYSEHLRDSYLREVAEDRFPAPRTGVIYPFDLPGRQHLLDKASELLRQEFPTEEDEYQAA